PRDSRLAECQKPLLRGDCRDTRNLRGNCKKPNCPCARKPAQQARRRLQMKDSEFTQLLNLYLDHEISAADAARLEAEVMSNPARRRVYQDYCRMQKACKLLASEFQSEAASADDRKVVAFEQTRLAARSKT